MLYDALRKGDMPGLATLLGGPELDHAYLHPGMVASLPTGDSGKQRAKIPHVRGYPSNCDGLCWGA